MDSNQDKDFLDELDKEYGGNPGGNPMAGVSLGHDDDLEGPMRGPNHSTDKLLEGKEATTAGGDKKGPVDMWCGCLSLAYYQRFFEVETADIVRRLKGAIMFFMPNTKNFLEEEIGSDPDMYGPVWISTTLVFVLSLASNFNSWAFTYSGDSWTYDMTMLVKCVSVVYGFTVGVPVLFYLGCRQMQIPLTFPQLLCLYGYSLTVFVPMTLLCLIPSALADWLLLAAGGGVAAAFLVRTLQPTLAERPGGKQLLAVVGSANILFFLVEKLVFFY